MGMYSNAYDNETYDPAAPVVEIGVSRLGSTEPLTLVIALVDSGADASMIPIDILQTAGARYTMTKQMRGVVGHPIVVEMYLVTLFIGSYVFPGVEVIAAAEGAEVVIGRDVLNDMVVTLNGLANVIEMTQ